MSIKNLARTAALSCMLAMCLGACSKDEQTPQDVLISSEVGSNEVVSDEVIATVEPATGADKAYVNARIWAGTGDGFREAIALQGETILAIGSREEIQSLISPTTEVVDLGGKLVVPGFIDNHTHFIAGALGLQQIDLRDADTPEEFGWRIAERASAHPGKWILYGDWDHELWGGELPAHDWIDEFTPDTPVFVLRLDGHMGLANSAALKLAGIDEETAAPEGGVIMRDEQGKITGVLKDTAMGLVEKIIPPPSEEQVDTALQAAIDLALSKGVTQVHDMGAWGDLAAFQRAHGRGTLRLRVYEFSPIAHAQELAEYISAHGAGDDWLRWGGVKGFVDGSLGSTTAWFYQPYDDAPETSGITLVDLELLARQIAAADAAGLQVAIHAIGDRANNWLLDTYAAVIAGNAPRDRRFRIEHAQHLAPQDIPRFAALGVIPAMQPYHAIDDGRWAEKRIGAERIKTTYAFRSLLDANVWLSFGSDWTVAPIDPLAGIYAAVTRRTTDGLNPQGWVPEQKISVDEALRIYTYNNAYAGLQESSLGSLEAGKLADFVVLSGDIFAMNPNVLMNVTVLRTVIGGRDAFIASP